MENTFMENLTNATNFMVTENGALAHKSTRSMVYDMFAFGGAYRKRTDEELLSTLEQLVNLSKEIEKECIEYNINFIDTSKDLLKDIDSAYERLIKD